MNILVLLVTLAMLYSVDGLRCKTCLYMEGSSDNDVMKLIMEALTKASHKECRDTGSGAEEQECGQLPPGSDAWGCGKGDVHTSLTQQSGSQSMTADLRMISRGCAPITTGDDRYSVGCHPASDFRDDISAGFAGGEESGLSMGDMSGEFCICEGQNCNAAVGKSPLVLLVVALTSSVFFLKQ